MLIFSEFSYLYDTYHWQKFLKNPRGEGDMPWSSEASFSLNNRYYDHCKNVFYPFSYQQLSGKHIPWSKSCSVLILTITEKMESNKKDYWKKFVTIITSLSIANNKDPSIMVKMHQTFFLFLPLFASYLLSGCDLFNM